MKLIVQADDYAMTDALAEGILYAAEHGCLTQTNLMTNGPKARYYAKRMQTEHPNIALESEINLVSGRPLSDAKEVPTLVDENGRLIRSGIRRREVAETGETLISYEDACREIDAQISAYEEICGEKPVLCGLHSFHTPKLLDAMKAVKERHQIKEQDTYGIVIGSGEGMGPWYPFDGNATNGISLDGQWTVHDPMKMFFDGSCSNITDHVQEEDYVGELHTHAGFIDRDLIEMSTLHMTRLLELDLICSERFLNWIKENNVQPVSFRQLIKERNG